MTKLSVLMACKNLNAQCSQSIQSILNQGVDLELIITVDGGENTLKVDDPRVQIHKFSVNRGMPVATNNCYKYATGEYITVHDDDDWSESGRFDLCLGQIGEDRAITSYIYAYKNNAPIEKKFHTDKIYYPGLKIKPPAHHCATMIKKDLWDEIGSYNERYMCSDSIRMIKLAIYTNLKKERFAVIEKPLYHYITRPRSLSKHPNWGNETRQTREKFFEEYENLMKMTPEQFLSWCDKNKL